MITRPKVRRWACWCGVALGAAAALALVVTCFRGFMLDDGPYRSVVLARGSIALNWQRRGTTINASGHPPHVGDPAGGAWRLLPTWTAPNRAFNGRFLEYEPGEIVVPLWMPVVFGLWCGYWLLPERPPAGLCECGYDLRAVPRNDGKATCPECGRVAAQESAA
jgi:hypothetical protein